MHNFARRKVEDWTRGAVIGKKLILLEQAGHGQDTSAGLFPSECPSDEKRGVPSTIFERPD